MKKLLYTLVFLISFNTTFAQTKEITEERIKILSDKLCDTALTYRTSSAGSAGKGIEDIIINFLGTSREDINYKAIITKFWNEHSDKFICYEDGMTADTRNPQHFMKRVVDLGMYQSVFYEFMLSDPEAYPIDVNTVEIYNGQKETILDYLDAIIANPDNEKKYNIPEIRNVREWLIDGYNAKKASELEK